MCVGRRSACTHDAISYAGAESVWYKIVLIIMLYHCIVVGAGIEGSSTAYQLLKSGAEKVLLLEQFELCHSNGSSAGQSRITRKAYQTLFYVKMMNDAFTMWSDLERESGLNLYKRTGLLVFGDHDAPYVKQTQESLKQANISHEVTTGAEANRRYSRQLNIPDTLTCVFEEDGGILYSQNALKAIQGEFMKLGGVILDNHKVIDIIPGEIVTVITNRGTFKTENIVLATGPWTPSLCSTTLGLQLPFDVHHIDVNYWKVDDPEAFSSNSFPAFIYANKDVDKYGFYYYGLPVAEYPGLLKVCCHHGVSIDHPDHRDDVNRGPITTEATAHFIGTVFKGVAKEPSVTEYCLYTMSPDTHPVIDRHPNHENIIIATGFSGHGFKLSPVFGKLLAQLVLKKTPSHDIHHFRITRFTTDNKSAL